MSFTVLYCGIRVREKVSLDSMSYQVILYHHKVTGVEGLNCPIISMVSNRPEVWMFPEYLDHGVSYTIL